jgi:hypothetical protein
MGVNAIKKIKVLTQFIGKSEKDDEGSNTENRLVIIFIYGGFHLK